MILVDSNLLLYAYDDGSPHHPPARRWMEQVFGAGTPVGLPLISVLAFLRISTNAAVFSEPLLPAEAFGIVADWLAQPSVSLVSPSHRHWSLFDKMSAEGQAKGSQLMDAHLAALAVEHGATLFTTDRGFARFPGLRFENPLPASSRAGRGRTWTRDELHDR